MLAEVFSWIAILNDQHLRELDFLRRDILAEMKELNEIAQVGKKPENFLFEFQNSTVLEPFCGFDLLLDSQSTSQYAGYETEV